MTFLSDFFPETSSGSNDRAVYRVHRKKGHPFALVPDGLTFQKCLAPLLPGQSQAARLYSRAARWLATVGWKFPRETLTLPLDPANPLVRLVKNLAPSPHPPFLLPGNPHGVAPRLVLMALKDTMDPVAVLKAGKTPEARDLVRREYQFLDALPAATGIPRVLGFVDDSDCTAFAMEFAEGNSPRWPADPRILEATLTPWIDSNRTETLGSLPVWRALRAALDQAAVPPLDWLNQMADLRIHPCLFHGDFAPWNVREDGEGRWTVIDWERGEVQGIPGWDWLHFVVQPAILVRKWPCDRVLVLAQETLQSREFLSYLATALPGKPPAETPEWLLRSYLLFNGFVWKPTEQINTHEALANWAMTGKEKS